MNYAIVPFMVLSSLLNYNLLDRDRIYSLPEIESILIVSISCNVDYSGRIGEIQFMRETRHKSIHRYISNQSGLSFELINHLENIEKLNKCTYQEINVRIIVYVHYKNGNYEKLLFDDKGNFQFKGIIYNSSSSLVKEFCEEFKGNDCCYMSK